MQHPKSEKPSILEMKEREEDLELDIEYDEDD